jgi:two-component system, NtrC family, sensor kinase
MRIISKLKFRIKLVLGITCIVVFTALLLSYVITKMASQALIEESKKRGRVLTENLSVRVADSMLAEDFLRLKNMVDELSFVDDIEYAFILNSQGNVMVHSFNMGFPRQLSSVHKTPERGVSIMLLDTGSQLIYDFAAPVIISEHMFGAIRIGLSRTKIQEVVNKLVLTIVGLSGGALVLAIIVSAVFGRQVTLRLNKLREYAEEVVKGNLDMQIGPALEKNCWNIMGCNLPQCPAYGDARRRCWYLAGTLCPECDEGSVTGKHESCKRCIVYKLNKGDEIQDLAETFDVMALTLKAHLDELKEAEQVLVRQKQLMGTILDVTPDFVCLLDENFVYLAVNKAFADFVGVEPTAIVGKTDTDIFPDDAYYIMMSAESKEVVDTGKTSHQEIHFTKDGREFWLHVVKVPVYDRSGKIIGLLRTARNITQLKQYQAQLIQSQKMESVGKLAGGVAHEINTPLGVILGYAQLLQEDVPAESQIRNDLATIEKQAKVCRKIVADLLGFSRQTESSKRDICFNNTLMEVVSLVTHTFSLDRVTIRMDLDDRLPVISADPEKLKQVWINLLNNARDAMEDGGAIYIKSRLNSPRQKVTVWVADSGMGISPDDLKRIFDPFFSTKPVGKGTGLGLSVSFGIIEDHGGEIYAWSPAPPELHPRNAPGAIIDASVELGPGTVFVVELPLDYDDTGKKYNPRGLE